MKAVEPAQAPWLISWEPRGASAGAEIFVTKAFKTHVVKNLVEMLGLSDLEDRCSAQRLVSLPPPPSVSLQFVRFRLLRHNPKLTIDTGERMGDEYSHEMRATLAALDVDNGSTLRWRRAGQRAL